MNYFLSEFTELGIMNMKNIGISLVALSLALLSGCSATSLRCGVDGESSFVELYGAPQHMSQNTRQFGELCGFAYEADAAVRE
jgi:outer membrane biogenesis lipoprotein LolB